jgi:ATP dependent DNA ligase domain
MPPKSAPTSKSPFNEPTKALPVQKLPAGDWLYEIEHDGYRALAFKDGKDVRLVSRNNKEFNYPQLLDALKSLPAEHMILDGKIVALRREGPLFVPAPPGIQTFRRCPSGLLRLWSAVSRRKRPAQTFLSASRKLPTQPGTYRRSLNLNRQT